MSQILASLSILIFEAIIYFKAAVKAQFLCTVLKMEIYYVLNYSTNEVTLRYRKREIVQSTEKK